MALSLSGKHILLTGATGGLGLSLARKFNETGAKLSLTGRNFAALEALKSELGGETKIFGADLTKREQCKAMIDYFRKENGSIQVLVNNAGTGWYKPFTEFSSEENDFILDVNLNSLVYLTHQLIPEMKENGSGDILNIASDLARRPLANMSLYTATKHGLAGLSQSLVRELKPHNIRVQMMAPGMIDTPFGGKATGDVKPPYALDPNDLADIAVFMLTRPSYLIMDEVSVHPNGQDF